MMSFQPVLSATQIDALRGKFPAQLQEDASLARYSSMRVGGKADFLLPAENVEQLATIVRWLWEKDIPFFLLGSGTNVLISDRGIRGLVVLNNADQIKFLEHKDRPQIWAGSGATIGLVARRTGSRGWTGLEWAAGVPGSVGGAVFGNAGAHGGDMGSSLDVAEILHHQGQTILRESWSVEQFQYEYRSSILKRKGIPVIVLSATFNLEQSTPEAVKASLKEFSKYRQETQPRGASLGSMFKNPPDHYAGRLIEQAGLKGTRRGGAMISEKHANFILNVEDAKAADVQELITLARETVREKFDVELELEIELVGDWQREQKV
jgi:UDP-N-acetylmuramate dehydrogenase